MDDDRFATLTHEIAAALEGRGEMLAAAESCTGGWIAKVLTDMPGSSRWFDRGFVTYSDQAKREMLGVSEQTLGRHGAVSEAVVREMAEGALARSGASVSIAVSGIAGPGGGSEEKPLGTVWFAWGQRGKVTDAQCVRFGGDREQVRRQAVAHALQGVWDRLTRA